MKGSKKITVIIRQYEINRVLKNPLELTLNDEACIIDAIKVVDREVIKKIGFFPVKGYKSLLHMVYHPIEERFYKQVSIQAYKEPRSFLNVREKPKMPLPDNTIIILIPDGPCITEWEDVSSP